MILNFEKYIDPAGINVEIDVIDNAVQCLIFKSGIERGILHHADDGNDAGCVLLGRKLGNVHPLHLLSQSVYGRGGLYIP